jgi:hypothetical protein
VPARNRISHATHSRVVGTAVTALGSTADAFLKAHRVKYIH